MKFKKFSIGELIDTARDYVKKAGQKFQKKPVDKYGRIKLTWKAIAKFETRISKGNIKVGKIPNISLPPLKSCSKAACQTCGKCNGKKGKAPCYALKAYNQYPNVRAAWDKNMDMALHDLETMYKELSLYFASNKCPEFFRLHVGGDFITSDYFELWLTIARNNPQVRFLAFTKQFDKIPADPATFPDNFSIVLSAWPGLEIPENLSAVYPVAYCIEKGDMIPARALLCPGHCENCGACWNLKNVNANVCFYKH